MCRFAVDALTPPPPDAACAAAGEAPACVVDDSSVCTKCSEDGSACVECGGLPPAVLVDGACVQASIFHLGTGIAGGVCPLAPRVAGPLNPRLRAYTFFFPSYQASTLRRRSLLSSPLAAQCHSVLSTFREKPLPLPSAVQRDHHWRVGLELLRLQGRRPNFLLKVVGAPNHGPPGAPGACQGPGA